MNKVILMGRLTRDAEIRWTQGQDQQCMARFTLAVDRRVSRDAQGQTADFPACCAYGKTAEFMEKYAKQGVKFLIEGRIRTGSYTNKDGVKVYTTEVVVESCEFAESKGSGSGQQANNGSNDGQQYDDNGFMSIPEGFEDGLPFN